MVQPLWKTAWRFLKKPKIELVKNPPQWGRPGFNPWVGKIPWRRERLPTPVFWPGEVHGLYSPWGHKESDMTEQLSLSELIYDSVIPLLGIHPEKSMVQKDTYTSNTSAWFTIAKIWKQPKYPSKEEWIKKTWYIHTMKYY